MSKLSREDILNLARLSRLRLSDEEVNQFAAELNSILEYVEQLSSVDTKGLEPTSQVTGLTNVMRPDKTFEYGTTSAELLKNAPALEDGQIKVRRVIE